MGGGFHGAILALLLGAANSPALTAAESAAASQIRDVRDRFNLAIDSQEPERIGAFLAPGYALVTGRGDRFVGIDANVELWRDTFRNDPTFHCARTPDKVTVNTNWGLAQETGRWVCTQTTDGEPGRYTGVYAAKWQRSLDAVWLLQVEVFTTLTCEGPEAACRRPDPITR